jgi:sulfatase modifying factor 1
VEGLASSARVVEYEEASDGSLVEELARVIWERDRATRTARAAGFPPQDMPVFETARVFWAKVVENARNGAVLGGVPALADAAARQFPGNVVFVRHRSSGDPFVVHPPSELEQPPERPSESRMLLGDAVFAKRGGVELVLVPAGKLWMGSREHEAERYDYLPDHLAALGGNPEAPRHEVELADFHLARTPVTNAQYREFLEHHERPGWVREPEHWAKHGFDQDQQPVVGVSWRDARAYCEWAGLVLPTEAQWEHACRAGTETRFHPGDREEDLARVGWYSRNSGVRLHAVGELEPNAWGLFDMHGNVWEWCLDAREPYATRARHGDGLRGTPVGSAHRACRGGSWHNDARCARSAFRGASHPAWRSERVGFRPARLRA